MSFFNTEYASANLATEKSIILTITLYRACSKIRELCNALMLTIYANYAPQISHYTPEICHYASRQNIIFLGHKTHFYIEYAVTK